MPDMTNNPKVLIVGGDSLLREGLRLMISTSFDVRHVRIYDIDLVLQAIREVDPDLLILLVGSTHQDIFNINSLKIGKGDLRTIVLSEDADHETLISALAAGVDGFLTRDITAETLLYSLRMVMLGERMFSARVVYELAGRRHQDSPDRTPKASVEGLTVRQADILQGLAEGLSNKEIARQLGTSEATVKVQVRSVLRRIGVQNRTQAAIWAIERGMGQTQGPKPGRSASGVELPEPFPIVNLSDHRKELARSPLTGA